MVCMVPVYGMYGARLRYVWCPFTGSMVPIYGMQSYGAHLRYVWCPLTGSMVPIYGMHSAGVKFEREKTALEDTQSRTCEVRGGITDEANRSLVITEPWEHIFPPDIFQVLLRALC